jgi:hypothetical protein
MRQHIAGRARQPRGEQPRQIGAIGMLQLEDKAAGKLVVEASGAQAIEAALGGLAEGA